MSSGPLIIIFIALGLALALLWLVAKMPRRRVITEKDRVAIISGWQEVERLMQGGRGKEAIFEADKLLDYIFKKLNLRGETFADRLKSAEKLLHNYQDIWTAHKLRNKLAHELDFQPSTQEIQQAIDIFDRAIRRLSNF